MKSRIKLLPFPRFLAQAKLTEHLLKSFKYTVVKGKLDLKTPLADTGQQIIIVKVNLEFPKRLGHL